MIHGLIDYMAIAKANTSSIQISEDYRDGFRSLLSKHKVLTINIEFTANVIETHKGGILNFYTDNVEIKARQKLKPKTRDQQNLLRAIERLIFFASYNREPLSNEINNIHEALLELYAPRKEAPIGDRPIIVRTGDPDLSTQGMARIIWGAWNELCLLDIPEAVNDAISNNLKNVWDAMKAWKYDHYYKIFRDLESRMDFEEYKATHPVCELTGRHGTVENPLERIHIISKGNDPGLYEKTWNYIMGLHSVHRRIHDKGWEAVLKDYPHMRRKYNDAHSKIERDDSEAVGPEIPSSQRTAI